MFGVGIFAPTFSRQATSFACSSLTFSGFSLARLCFFADVVFEVVEFLLAVFEELDELPIAGVDGAAGLGAPFALAEAEIAGEVPVDGVAV